MTSICIQKQIEVVKQTAHAADQENFKKMVLKSRW